MRTFDELIRTALVDLAKGAVPTDLADAALSDAARRGRLLVLGAATITLVTITSGLVVGFAIGGETPQGRFRPDQVAPSQHRGTPSAACVTAASPATCSASANVPLAASERPSKSPSPSERTSPTPTASATSGTYNAPGNRPHPKPTKPGRRR